MFTLILYLAQLRCTELIKSKLSIELKTECYIERTSVKKGAKLELVKFWQATLFSIKRPIIKKTIAHKLNYSKT